MISNRTTIKRSEPRSPPSSCIKSPLVPISVSLGDTLERVPKHICDRNPKELIRAEIYGRAGEARNKIRAEFMPENIHLFTAKRCVAIVEWYDQLPNLGFNCGRYDLNLIKEHFAGLLADTTAKVLVGKKSNTTMFIKINGFRLVGIINYLGRAPATKSG